MEFIIQGKPIRLRSRHNRYLVAGNDGESVKQSRHGQSRKAHWTVELVEGRPNMVRLRSCFDKFLTASNEHFLLGWTGHKAFQTVQTTCNPSIHWEPIGEDGVHCSLIKLRSSLTEKFLRANGGTPPWRGSVTVDLPESRATKSWVLWTVELVDGYNGMNSGHKCGWRKNKFKSLAPPSNYEHVGGSDVFSRPRGKNAGQCSSSSSIDDGEEGEGGESTWGESDQEDLTLSFSRANKNGMELFQRAKTVRLRSHHDKYLLAEDDTESVCQDRHHSGSRRARWTVEHVTPSVEGVGIIRLKSCYDKYLTATDDDFFMGVTGKKVKQTVPRRLDSSIEWEPIRDGMQVKLKTRYGNFLRANGGVPPWRNSITHDVPSRSHTQDWILWDVEVLEVYERRVVVEEKKEEEEVEGGRFGRCESEVEPFSFQPPAHGRTESGDFASKHEGRLIHYNVVDDDGNIVEGEHSIDFKGSGVEELTQTLENETGLSNIIVCSRSPLNKKLYPMRLALPPNHVKLHVYVVPSSSKAAAEFTTV